MAATASTYGFIAQEGKLSAARPWSHLENSASCGVLMQVNQWRPLSRIKEGGDKRIRGSLGHSRRDGPKGVSLSSGSITTG